MRLKPEDIESIANEIRWEMPSIINKRYSIIDSPDNFCAFWVVTGASDVHTHHEYLPIFYPPVFDIYMLLYNSTRRALNET